MASCPRITGCPLFQQFSMKAALRVWMGQYCESQFSRCERLRLATSGKEVPLNLLPNGRMLKVAPAHAEMNDVT